MSREKADQLEESAINRAAIVAEQQTGQTLRKQMDVEGRKDVAETRTQADIDKANITAKAKVDAAMIAADKWKDHSRFAAFKEKAKQLAIEETDPVKYSAAVKALYESLLPSGEPNTWDSDASTPLPAPPATSRFRWTPEGIRKIE